MKFWDLLTSKDPIKTASDEAKKAAEDVLNESFLGRMIVDNLTDRNANSKEGESKGGRKMSGLMVELCSSCGSNSRNKCIKCGSSISSNGVMAQFCSSCGSNSRNKCIKCGNSTSSNGVMAQLCSSCGSNSRNKCIKCGSST